MTGLNLIRIILTAVLTCAAAFVTGSLTEVSRDRQNMAFHYAELHSIEYGLLSVHAWKRQIAEIITSRVREFQLTASNRAELRKRIQAAMHTLLDEVDKVMESRRKERNWLQNFVADLMTALVFDLRDLRKHVPELTEVIIDQIDNLETREQLRAFILGKIDDLLIETVGPEDLTRLAAIGSRYGCEVHATDDHYALAEHAECSALLEAELHAMDRQMFRKSAAIVLFATLAFVILFAGNGRLPVWAYAIPVMMCGVLLYGGVSTPMIGIDARIDHFEFTLIGETLAFSDQILFFQSKSILEVVHILVATADIQSVAVGALIFLFSIIFPVGKLIASLIVVRGGRWQKNRVLQFLALRSGKWSMADVMVVAIFMAFIGFRGLIGSQLRQIEGISERIEILTTDHSQLGEGFVLFLAFCLAGLFLATLIERQRVYNNSHFFH